LCQKKKKLLSSQKLGLFNILSATSVSPQFNTVGHCYKSKPLQPSIAGGKAHGIKSQT